MRQKKLCNQTEEQTERKQSAGNFRKIKIKKNIPLTQRQIEFLELSLSDESDLMFCVGPAGTSKTYLTILSALEMLNQKKIQSMLYVRSAVESSDNKLGFLPGEEAMKLEPYLRPLRDKVNEFLTQTEISYMWKNEMIDAEHVGYARGQDWKDKVIIIDEAQNLTKKELLTLTTRCGENSKVFIIGDPMQSDIGNKSGFVEFFNMFDNADARKEKIQCFKFTEDDIVRSRLVKFIIQTYLSNENTPTQQK